jgi:hypothetical protein
MADSHRSSLGPLWSVAFVIFAASGLVLSLSWMVDWPSAIDLIAWIAFPLGIVTFGVRAFLDNRASGAGYWTSLGRVLRDALKAIFDFM